MILHLDMDAFFASIEQLDNPDLRGRPVVVGGQTRGVVATASYEARVYGIHSAMPTALARRLCPHACFLRGRYKRYRELSMKVMDCLRRFSPIVQAASIDEAYIDVTELRASYSTPGRLAADIKQQVKNVTGGLTCSIGIAPVKFLAKICSDINKPDGVFILSPDHVDDFLLPLPVARIPGVGKAMQASLKAYGVTKVAELRELSAAFLFERYGKWGLTLFERARGIDNRPVHVNQAPKSESAERTFPKDIWEREYLAKALLTHAERVSASLDKHGLFGHTVTLKIKFANFSQITRSKSYPSQFNAVENIYGAACALLDRVPLSQPVRLIGLGVSGFDCGLPQLRLPGI